MRPLATARAQIVMWIDHRQDGSAFVTIDVAGLARFHANVLKGHSKEAPFALGKGVTVWKKFVRDAPDQYYFRVKVNRSKEPFVVFPEGFVPRARSQAGPRGAGASKTS